MTSQQMDDVGTMLFKVTFKDDIGIVLEQRGTNIVHCWNNGNNLRYHSRYIQCILYFDQHISLC